jgi:hypothetical protein
MAGLTAEWLGSLLDIEANPLFGGHAHGGDEDAQRTGGSSLLADDLSDVGGIDRDAETASLVQGDALDVDALGMIDHEFDQGGNDFRDVLRVVHD